jgi:hypothetical protein
MQCYTTSQEKWCWTLGLALKSYTLAWPQDRMLRQIPEALQTGKKNLLEKIA